MIVSEYLNNLYYDIYKNYPLFIFNEILVPNSNKIINFISITKVKYDKKNKILFFIENKDSYIYIPLDKAGNANIKFFNDIINLNIDTVIVSSKRKIENINNDDLINLEIKENLSGKKIPFEIFEPTF